MTPVGPQAELTETVPILKVHVEELLAALNAAYNISAAEDLIRANRAMGGQTAPTRLTKSLETQFNRFESYLNGASVEASDEPVSE